MKWKAGVAAAVLALCWQVAQAADCSRPATGTERLICSNDRVSEADQRMAFAFFLAYRRAPDDARKDAVRRAQRTWEKEVRDPCPDVPCLLRVYEERTLDLEQN
ncbi:MAG: DUF1311 domain-containing protein [Betaproteobacteria bacterium]|nr:DUF1311 domain-containing protein [Betaproteobacteria bacterium]